MDTNGNNCKGYLGLWIFFAAGPPRHVPLTVPRYPEPALLTCCYFKAQLLWSSNQFLSSTRWGLPKYKHKEIFTLWSGFQVRNLFYFLAEISSLSLDLLNGWWIYLLNFRTV